MIRSYVQLNLQESVPHTSLDYLITLLLKIALVAAR